MFPNKKKIIVGIYTVIGIIFELLIFIKPTGEGGAFIIEQPESGNLIDSAFNRANLAYWIILFLQISIIGLLAIGYAIKAKQASGEIRKKFIYLSVASLIFFICGVFDSILPPGPYLAAWRGGMMTYSLWMYLGLKT